MLIIIFVDQYVTQNAQQIFHINGWYNDYYIS